MLSAHGSEGSGRRRPGPAPPRLAGGGAAGHPWPVPAEAPPPIRGFTGVSLQGNSRCMGKSGECEKDRGLHKGTPMHHHVHP